MMVAMLGLQPSPAVSAFVVVAAALPHKPAQTSGEGIYCSKPPVIPPPAAEQRIHDSLTGLKKTLKTATKLAQTPPPPSAAPLHFHPLAAYSLTLTPYKLSARPMRAPPYGSFPSLQAMATA